MREFEKIRIGERKEKKISKEELIESLRNWLRKPEDFVDRTTEKFPENKWPRLLETIKELKEKIPGKMDRKIVNMAIFFQTIKESPKGILLKDLAEKSKFSQMSVSRYVKELKEKNLITTGGFGKEIVFEAKKFPGTLPELILKILKEKEKTSLKELTQELSELLGRKIDQTTLMRRVRELEKEKKIGVKRRVEGKKTAIFLPEKKAEVRSYPEIVFEYIKENPGASARGVIKELKVGSSTVSKIVLELIREGKIVKFKMERGRTELYDRKSYEEVKKLGIEKPQKREMEVFIFLQKYGIMPTLERVNWTLKKVDDYLRERFLTSKEIESGLRKIAFWEDKTSLNILERLKEIAPKDFENNLKLIERKFEEIKKTKPEAERILEVIEKIKSSEK